MTSLPVLRYLTPEPSPLAPQGFTLVDERLTRGLPHTFRLDGNFSLLLVAPNGVALPWRDENPAVEISTAARERQARARPGLTGLPPALPIGIITRFPLRFLLLFNGVFLGSVPLVAGLRRFLPEAHESIGAGVELLLLDWTVCAGSLRGIGDFGTRVKLAWRRL